MQDNLQAILTKLIMSILLFPTLFQEAFIKFAWGNEDLWWILTLKRLLILLPTVAIIFACWGSLACLLTVPFRHRRTQLLSAIVITWWDLGRSIFSFWAGLVKFIFYLTGWIFNFVRLMLYAIWFLIQDIILSPFRVARDVGQGYFRPGIPWIAVIMTILWSLLEATVFTYVMTPLVKDVLAGMASGELSESVLQVPLFFMLFAFILGSYAVLATWGEGFKSKDISKIIQIGTFELFVVMFEVMFLYREFVDALVPWFAQHSGGQFQLGLVGTILIATFAWLGIRGMTWFLFAGSGTPTIMAIIKRTGLTSDSRDKGQTVAKREETFAFINAAIDKIKKDIDWVHTRGNELLGALVLPPLQILAAMINFCTLFLFSNHLFELPFANIKDIAQAKILLNKVKQTTREE